MHSSNLLLTLIMQLTNEIANVKINIEILITIRLKHNLKYSRVHILNYHKMLSEMNCVTQCFSGYNLSSIDKEHGKIINSQTAIFND